jgi:uncharacterized protein DUF6176
MAHVSFWKVRPGQEERLRAWLMGLNRREDEVRPTLVQEGVTHEMAFLVSCDGGPIMVLASEAEDVEEALRISRASTLPFDVEARRVTEEATSGQAAAEHVWQLSR